MSTPLLELRDVARHYPVSEGIFGTGTALVRAVDGVTLTLHKGETLGLVGESGCGKSTLGRVALGLERPDTGEVLFDGAPVSGGLSRQQEKDFRRRAQMIFQDPYSSLNPRRSVGATIREGLDIHRVETKTQRNERVRELLETVGLLPEHAKRYPHEFSGGQRQRVAVARALALDPDLVVCDEPVSALDVSVQAQVLNLLASLKKRLGLTYLFISHDLSVVGHVSDRVAVMYLGRIMELADSKDLFADPLHPYSRSLLAAIPVPDPEIQPDDIRLEGDLPSPLNPPSGCPFHPRCPQAFDRCPKERPELLEVQPGRVAACWLHQD